LIRLHRSSEQQADTHADDLLIVWQNRWSGRQDAIARKLAAIELQLEQLAEREQPRLRLSIVGTPPNADQMTAMGPF
jgi:hypothetical protein